LHIDPATCSVWLKSAALTAEDIRKLTEMYGDALTIETGIATRG
jgi:hypothetical protein